MARSVGSSIRTAPPGGTRKRPANAAAAATPKAEIAQGKLGLTTGGGGLAGTTGDPLQSDPASAAEKPGRGAESRARSANTARSARSKASSPAQAGQAATCARAS